MTGDQQPTSVLSTFHPVIPLHYQIQRVLRAQIETGKWAVGGRVPPEHELMRRFEVSRTTIRRALRWLEADGLIVRQRRRGTFVAKSTSTEPTSQGIKSLLLGYSAEIKVLGVADVEPPNDVAQLLGVGRDRKVREYRRLEIVEGRPLAVVFNYVRLDVAKRIKNTELQRFSMLEIMRDRLKLNLGPLRQSVRAELPDENIAGLLRSDVSEPVLAIRLVVHGRDGTPIQLCDAFYRGRTYRFETETFLPEGEPANREGIADSGPLRPRGKRRRCP